MNGAQIAPHPKVVGRAPGTGRRSVRLGRCVASASDLLASPVALLAVAFLGVGLVVRTLEARGALLYPDGYQYLLMARGIASHLTPTIQLGPQGAFFVPSADASLKPLFPAIVALAHLAGAGWAQAARDVSIVSGAASVTLCALLTKRLTASFTLAAVAGLIVLFEPNTRYWAAFSSPDSLGQALALGAVLAAVSARPRLGGLLAGLAIFARPEVGLLLVAGAVVAAVRPAYRHRALDFATSALSTAGVVLIVLRPPLQLRLEEVVVALLGALTAAVLAILAPPRVGVAAGLAALVVGAARGSALPSQAAHELLVVLLFVAALTLARHDRAAAVVSVAAGALVLGYELRNGASARYLTQLVPLVAVGIAVGAAHVRAKVWRPLAIGGAGLGVFAVVTYAAPVPPGPDMFHSVAAALPHTAQPILTSADDAYGFLLYPASVRPLTRGAHGLVLVDATTRAYDPGLVVHGRILERLPVGDGFVTPLGRLDRGSALLIQGRAR
jgi:hypothetical protein